MKTRRQWRWRAQTLIWLNHTLGFHDRVFSRVRLHDLDSAETGNRAWKVCGAQGSPVAERKVEHRKSCSVSSALFLVLISRCVVVPIKNKGVLATTATATATRTSKQQRFIKQKKHVCTWITLFATWKCLISRFMEDENKLRQNFPSVSKLECGPQEISSREIYLH